MLVRSSQSFFLYEHWSSANITGCELLLVQTSHHKLMQHVLNLVLIVHPGIKNKRHVHNASSVSDIYIVLLQTTSPKTSIIPAIICFNPCFVRSCIIACTAFPRERAAPRGQQSSAVSVIESASTVIIMEPAGHKQQLEPAQARGER